MLLPKKIWVHAVSVANLSAKILPNTLDAITIDVVNRRDVDPQNRLSESKSWLTVRSVTIPSAITGLWLGAVLRVALFGVPMVTVWGLWEKGSGRESKERCVHAAIGAKLSAFS